MARLGPFEARPRLALAVSGGADSTCLAALALDWARARDGAVLALIVDHRLRPESGAEAALVAARMAALGVSARILARTGPPLATRIQATARADRYALLEAATAGWPALHLLTAHHADDQAETIVMRRAAGSGPVGLAGMSAVAERAGCRIVRPLLSFPKARLVATVAARGLAWVDDPSNADPRFLRARLRQEHADAPLTDGGARSAIEMAANRFLAERLEVGPDGRAALARAGLGAVPRSTLRQAVARLLAAIGQRPYPPRGAGLDRLVERLSNQDDVGALTLHRCIVRFGPKMVRITPERAIVGQWHPPVPISAAPFATCHLASVAG